MGKKYLLVLLAICLLPVTLQARDYEIRFERPARIGDTFYLAAKGWQSEKSIIRMDGELLRDDRENFLLDFEGVITVLDIDDKGRVISESAKVIKCEKTEAYERKPLVREGVVIEATLREGKVDFVINGKPAEQEISTALDILFPMKKGGATDDEIFGTKVRKKVGDKWGINRDAVATEFRNDRKMVNKEGISGGSRLEKVVEVNGVEWLQIGSELTVNGLIPDLPDGIAVERSSMQATFLSKLPAEGDRMPLEEATGMDFSFLARGKPEPASPEIVVESSLNLRVKQTSSLLRAGSSGKF